MTQLAIFGGPPVRTRSFHRAPNIGPEEKQAVLEVLDSGVLSSFLASWGPHFHGGPRVRQLETAWAQHFGVKHAISVNSATSGLYAAVGALGIRPGDEVIVTPYTMSASATGILVYGATPVFADVLPDTFTLDPDSVRRCITERTKAIIAVDLFGHPAEMDQLMGIAREHGLRVIEDAAQAPGAVYRGRLAGTLADVGVFSLNYHKSIHSGEGGIVVTENDDIADRVQLIRNHAEVVVAQRQANHLADLIGFNFRMTEVEAAIAREQLRKLEHLTGVRTRAATLLTRFLGDVPGIRLPVTRADSTHVYYVYAMRYDSHVTGIPRETFVRALNAEGIPMYLGYVEPIYLEPIYHAGRRSWERYPRADGWPSYGRGTCPVTERLQYDELIYTDICRAELTDRDGEDLRAAVDKVLAQADQLAAVA